MKKNNKNLKFSIIIPSYNEKDDVRISIEAALNQTYSAHEILVVDDSTDNTPEIINEYKNQGVSLVKGPGKGCCEARNLGISKAEGDIIVIFSADVAPPPKFLERLIDHYNNGADWVVVNSEVFNTDNIFGKFLEAQHKSTHKGDREDLFSVEGLSAKREAALDVGGFSGDFDVKFCRDWTLGKKLRDEGYKKSFDFSIVLPHKAPDNLKEFWQVRKTRGRFSSLLQFYLLEKPFLFVSFKMLAKVFVTFLNFILLLPASIKMFTISRETDNKFKNFFILFYPYFIQEIGVRIGELEGIKIIINKEYIK